MKRSGAAVSAAADGDGVSDSDEDEGPPADDEVEYDSHPHQLDLLHSFCSFPSVSSLPAFLAISLFSLSSFLFLFLLCFFCSRSFVECTVFSVGGFLFVLMDLCVSPFFFFLSAMILTACRYQRSVSLNFFLLLIMHRFLTSLSRKIFFKVPPEIAALPPAKVEELRKQMGTCVYVCLFSTA